MTATSKPTHIPPPVRESTPVASDAGLLAQNEAMQARIEKLEQVVFGTTPSASLFQNAHSKAFSTVSLTAEKAVGKKLCLYPGEMDVRLCGAVS